MQKINLKKTTKDKLYAMLCELDENYQSLKDETERRVETLNDELIKTNVEIAGLHGALEEAQKLADKKTKDVEELFDMSDVDAAPTVDAVEVVRCRECKWYQEGELLAPNKFCFRLKHPNEDRKIGYNYAPDDFCSHGERKDG